jgi:ABC-type transport system involved in multi-copper enzyme maturation permease subunit
MTTATLPAATRHQLFSPARIYAIASNTLLELVRLKVFYFVLIFALLIIGSSAFTAKLTFQEQFQVLKDVSLGAMSIFTWLLAVLATAMLLPKDIEDRTLYTILAKPVPRFEYLLGKLLGVFALLFIALSLMSVVFVIVLYSREQSVIALAMQENSPGPQLDAAIAEVKAATFTTSLIPGIIVIYLKAALCAALTLLLSTFASSWIFTIIVSVVIYLIGHVQPIAREYWLTTTSVGAGGKLFLALVSLLFPDLTAFNLVDDIVAGNVIALGLFLKTVALGATYIAAYFLAGYFMFSTKEL